MFGDIEAQEPEHSQMPILKLIDFGEAQTKSAPARTFPFDAFWMKIFDTPLNLDKRCAFFFYMYGCVHAVNLMF